MVQLYNSISIINYFTGIILFINNVYYSILFIICETKQEYSVSVFVLPFFHKKPYTKIQKKQKNKETKKQE